MSWSQKSEWKSYPDQLDKIQGPDRLRLSMIRLLTMIMFPSLIFGWASLALAAWEQSGKFTLGYQSFYQQPEQVPTNYQKSNPKTEVEPSFQWSSETSRVKFKALLGYDQSFTQGKDKAIGIPEEFFWETKRGRNNWIVGINTFNWGVTDIVNPLDVLNTRSYRNLLSPQKIGSPAISWNHARDRWSFEFVYIPVQLPPQLPGEGSRFFPQGESLERFASQNQAAVFVIPNQGIRYHIQKSEDYDNPFHNNVGTKLRWNTDSLETHLVGFEGHPGLPNFDPRPVFDTDFVSLFLNPDFDIVPQYQRVRVGGVGFVYTANSFILRLAHAQVWKTKANLSGTVPVLVAQPKTTVLALEKPFSIRSLENTLILQGVAQTDPEQHKESALSTRPIYDGAAILGLRTSVSIDWSLTLGVLANGKAKVQIYSYDLLYRLNDHTQLQLTGQHFSGATGTLIHSIAQASNANLNLMTTW